MRKKIELFTIFLLLVIVPAMGWSHEIWSKEKGKRVRPKEEVVVKIKYGKKDGEFGRKDFEDGFPITPRAFTFDAEKNIYIADDTVNGTPRVQVFNSKGMFLRKIPLKSQHTYPFVVIDIVVRNDKLYVLLYRENIQVFTLAGELIRTINYYMGFDLSSEWTDALYNPSRMEVDSLGNIYLSSEAGALVKLDAQGKLLQKWSEASHYIDASGNLFAMDLSGKTPGPVAEYAANGNKILEGRCDDLFPFPSGQKRCRLPDFMDKEGNMYRRFEEKFKDGFIPRVIKYSKRESVLLETDLFVDEQGEYYRVDKEGNIYTIKHDLIKYVSR